jgi:hypothetical protein
MFSSPLDDVCRGTLRVALVADPDGNPVELVQRRS